MRQNPDWRPIESAPRDGTWINLRYGPSDASGIAAAWVYGIWDGEEQPKGKWWNGYAALQLGMAEWSPAWAPCRPRPQNLPDRQSERVFLEDNPPKPELFSQNQPKTDRIPHDWLLANRLRIRAKAMQALMDGFLRAAKERGLKLSDLEHALQYASKDLIAGLYEACEELDDYADLVFALGMDLETSLCPEDTQ